jgi:hypothetical protein
MASGAAHGPRSRRSASPRGDVMLETITVLLVLLWLLGMITSYTLAGYIHLLLFLAIAVVLVRLLSGRRIV